MPSSREKRQALFAGMKWIVQSLKGKLTSWLTLPLRETDKNSLRSFVLFPRALITKDGFSLAPSRDLTLNLNKTQPCGIPSAQVTTNDGSLVSDRHAFA
jgi:hypothetical protein